MRRDYFFPLSIATLVCHCGLSGMDRRIKWPCGRLTIVLRAARVKEETASTLLASVSALLTLPIMEKLRA